MLAPTGNAQLQAICKSSTLFLVICSRGLWPRLLLVRRQISQSLAGGFNSIASVTGLRLASNSDSNKGPLVL